MKPDEFDPTHTPSEDTDTRYSPPPTHPVSGEYNDTETAQETRGRDIPSDLDYLILGKYRLIKMLGKGGMGQIYLAEHTELRKLVAIKIIAEQLSSQPPFISLFKREARSAAKLQHPNVARVFDYGEEKGKCFYVMDYVQGNSLAEIIDSSAPLPLKRALAIFRQILEALDHAHKSGVVHRDVKPTNIIVDDSGLVKLLDFGLARSIYGDDSLTAVGQSPGGTPSYTSPEQRRGESTDARTDIYSAGVTMFEMLTGVVPRDINSPRDRLLSDLRKNLNPLERIRASQLANTVMKCLDDVSRRYKTAQEVLADVGKIERAMQHQRWLLRSAAGAFAAAAVAVVAVLALTTPKSQATDAARYLEERDFSRAAELFAELTRKHPADMKNRYGLGLSYIGMGELDRAKSEFEKIARSLGKDTTADEEGLARVAYARNDQNLALELYGRAVETGRDRTLIHVTIGDIYLLRNQLDKAINEYEQALNRDPIFRFQLADAYAGLGRAYSRRGDLDEARDSLMRAEKARPSDAEIASALGYVLMQKGDYEAALKAIEKAEDKKRDDSLATFLRSELARKNDAERQKRIAALVDDLIKAAEKTPQAPEETWESRPTVLAILPLKKTGSSSASEHEQEFLMFSFARAMHQAGRVTVVEREVLSELLTELKLGTSEIAAPEAALALRKIYPAGFIAAGTLRNESGLFGLDVRLAETETTRVSIWTSETQSARETLQEFAERLAKRLTQKIRETYPLKATIAKLDEKEVTLNIGSKHGLARGTEMKVIKLPSGEGIGTLTVKDIKSDSATAEIIQRHGQIAVGDGAVEIVKKDAP